MEELTMKKKILIEGMSCEHCVAHVKDALEGIDGVSSVLVNLEGKYATVETDVNDEILKEAIEEEGYDVVKIEE
jgi:copper chaperone